MSRIFEKIFKLFICLNSFTTRCGETYSTMAVKCMFKHDDMPDPPPPPPPPPMFKQSSCMALKMVV